MELHETKKPLYSKGNSEQSKEATKEIVKISFLIHLELMLVYKLSWGSCFVPLHAAIQWSQSHLLKRPVSFMNYFQFFSKISLLYTCGLPAVVCILFHCSSFVSVPVPACFDDHCPVICLEIWNFDSRSWFLFSRID